ncbi:MAG: hypothetical protein IKW90_07660 [Lachnospiraceae bacterium]|nr:hypothetical protein [Lachnospiraceae bacterium]
MARTLTARDCHALMNLLVKEATGQDAQIQVVDSSTFVSAGEAVLATGTENVLNALSLVLGRTFMAVRPYNAKLALINAINTGEYTHRMRKISFYSREAQASGDWNTQLYTNLADGFTNGQNIDDGTAQSTKSMWEQNQPVPLEMNFAGSSVWEDSTTIYEYQLQQAFRSEDEFGQFVAGIMTERGNDIESQKEAFNRMTLLNFMAGVYDLNQSGSVVNLTSAFNTEFGTNYTSAQLRTTYLKEFCMFLSAKIKIDSDMLTNRSKKAHWAPAKEGYALLRHTPKDRQRLMLYNPLLIKTQAYVFPELFNEQYLKMENYEGVMFWQNENDPSAIKVTPAIPDTTGLTGVQTAGDTVTLDYVVGMLYDVDALMVDYQLDNSAVTPLEARKHYRNMWWSFAKNAICDFTENAIIYIMADPAPSPSPDAGN